MNKRRRHADEIIAWANGKQIQVGGEDGLWHDVGMDEGVTPRFGDKDRHYRIKPIEFPPLPPGYSYHNPLNLSPEEFGCDKGWRPAVLYVETQESQAGHKRGWEHKSVMYPEWQAGSWSVNHTNKTECYRTKLPLPEFPKKKVKKRVPLGVEDFDKMGGAIWVRQVGDVAGGTYLVLSYRHPSYANSINIANDVVFGKKYTTLMDDNWEWSADRQSWMPCYKEIEVDAK